MKKIKKCVFTCLLSLWAAAFLTGCSQLVLFDPKGSIGAAERFVIIVAIALMLIVVIPVVCMVFLFSRKYRASNPKATYMPKWSRSGKIELIIWVVPAAIIAVIGTMIWITTHQLDPYKPIDTGIKPINIEAVSLDWKWLFIYPDQQIATVNQLVFPVNVPLSFKLTSATVMTSFFIPRLGSQIYAMAGMQTRLHLIADQPGIYLGQNQQFSGRGYSEMNFKAIATSSEAFERWIQKVKQSPDTLDLTHYEQIARPSIGYPVAHFSSVKPDLFDYIIHQFTINMPMNSGAMNAKPGVIRMKTSVSEER